MPACPQQGRIPLSEWTLAQADKSEELAQLHFFSMKKRQDGKEIEFTITVREYATPREVGGRFFAQADKQTNQEVVPFIPCGCLTDVSAAGEAD